MIAALALSLAAPYALIRRSVVDLVPGESLPLGGYTARGSKTSEPGGEVLHSRTTIVSQGATKIAVVVVDMLTVPQSLSREVAVRIPKDLHLFLIATHTHSAPDSQMLNDRMTFAIPGIASYKSRWLKWYADKITVGIQAALKANGVSIDAWSTRTAHLALNRGRRVGALPDTTGTLIGTAPGGNLWFHYAAHAVFWGPERLQTSGDWPAAVTRQIGADVLVGAIGDVSPAAPGDDPDVRIRNFALKVESAYKRPGFVTGGGTDTIRWATAPIALDKRLPHPDFAKDNHIPDALAQTLTDKFAPEQADVAAFRIGKIAVVGIPGEPTSHLGRRIRDYGRNLGFEHVLVCSHVNGWIGYILDAPDYARGGYEATLSFYGPQEGDRVVEAADSALKKLLR